MKDLINTTKIITLILLTTFILSSCSNRNLTYSNVSNRKMSKAIKAANDYVRYMNFDEAEHAFTDYLNGYLKYKPKVVIESGLVKTKEK